MLLDTDKIFVGESKSILAFETEGNDAWPEWDRFISIDGKKAFEIGNICGTCEFYFKRLEGANRGIDPKPVVDVLNSGLTSLSDKLVHQLGMLLPNGPYRVLLSEIVPSLVSPGDSDDYFVDEQIENWGLDAFYNLPHFPHTEYYRIDKKHIDPTTSFFEFLIPTFPQNWLNGETVETYKKAIAANRKPTAISLSVLDIKEPASVEGELGVQSHWCLAHYLVDGHHKVFAAAQNSAPLTLLSFVALEHGVSNTTDIDLLTRSILPRN